MMLVQYVIYDRPRDYPNKLVVRRWLIEAGISEPTPGSVTTHDTLDEARRVIPRGFVCIARSPDDDPCIVEVWV